jgi:hypothetical protein
MNKFCSNCRAKLEELTVVCTEWDKEGKYTNVSVISFMLFGGEVRYYDIFECPNCGKLEFYRVDKCPNCNGTGKMLTSCPSCNSSITGHCDRCRGTGVLV